MTRAEWFTLGLVLGIALGVFATGRILIPGITC
jgi:hypothetical protein